jgi:signal transduction histidine kinase
MKNTPDSWFGIADNQNSNWTTEPEPISFDRLWCTLMRTRIMTANVLLLLQAFINVPANTNNGWSIALCAAYLCATLWVWRSIWSDGEPLEKTVQMHLFEPFFTSVSRSSGLGLYLCRELRERYAALIGYQRTSQGNLKGSKGNAFFVILKLAASPLHTAVPLADGLFA